MSSKHHHLSSLVLFLTMMNTFLRRSNGFVFIRNNNPKIIINNKNQRFSSSFFFHRHPTLRRLSATTISSSTTSKEDTISKDDEKYLKLAVEYAKIGYGHTFPNPAVGCVIVSSDKKKILGKGFHPRAGMPHAEVFALFEAAGHLEDGVDAAKSALYRNDTELQEKVTQLTDIYLKEGGPEELFQKFESDKATAYVTLEPCCHYGKTPPCASSLVKSKIIDRVVVGFRDPNPRVDGGGVQVLQNANIAVLQVESSTHIGKECQELVTNFVKRITPSTEEIIMNGAKRRELRALAGRLKANRTLTQAYWVGDKIENYSEDAILQLSLDPSWMEKLDDALWNNELVLLRLNNAVNKKKGAKVLGNRIAEQLAGGTEVVQVVGHTVLLYRANTSTESSNNTEQQQEQDDDVDGVDDDDDGADDNNTNNNDDNDIIDDETNDDDENPSSSTNMIEDDNETTTNNNIAKEEKDLQNLTVAQLKDKLRDANLPVSGKKAMLIERLSSSLSEVS